MEKETVFNSKQNLKNFTKTSETSISIFEDVKLSIVDKVSNFQSPFISKILTSLYQRSDEIRFLAPLLNSAATEIKYTFFFDFYTVMTLVIKDPNLKNKEFSSKEFKALLDMIKNSNILKILDEYGPEELVLSWNHPGICDFFKKALGPTKIQEQKIKVLQWVRQNKVFDEDLPPLPDIEEEGLSSIELAKKKAMSYGLMKKKDLKQELDNAVQSFEHESKKYQVLIDRARQEDLKRIESQNDPSITNQAVAAGIKAQEQKKLVMELEYKLLLLRERYEKRIKHTPRPNA